MTDFSPWGMVGVSWSIFDGKRNTIRLWKYRIIAAIIVLHFAGYWNSKANILHLPSAYLSRHKSEELVLKDPPVIKQVMIREDDFLRGCQINGSLREIKKLKTSLSILKVNVSKSFTISLTTEQQMALENSTGARNIRNIWKTKNRFENLFKMAPLKFLPEFKNPCWFNAKRDLRCLPYFLLVGAPKAGTTDVFSMLQFHPDFKSRYNDKEPHWLARGRYCTTNFTTPCSENTLDRYAEHIARPITHLLKKEAVESKSGPKTKKGNAIHGASQLKNEDPPMKPSARSIVTGDCSPSALWDNSNWPLNDENFLPLEPIVTNADFAYHLYNRTKIIAILRNPVTRLYSDYMYFDKTQKKGPENFHRDIITAIRYYNDCFEKYSVRSCVYSARELEKTEHVKLEKGIYFIQLQEWLRVFPRDQILILQLEDYTRNRTQTVRKIYNFLGLRNLTSNHDVSVFTLITNGSTVYNHSERQGYQNNSMFSETRYILYTFYKPFNQALARLLNDSRFDYGPC